LRDAAALALRTRIKIELSEGFTTSLNYKRQGANLDIKDPQAYGFFMKAKVHIGICGQESGMNSESPQRGSGRNQPTLNWESAMRMSSWVRAIVLGSAIWLGFGAVPFAQNTNQVMGQVNFEGKTKIDKSSGVWVDGQYLGYVSELKGSKKVLLVPGKHAVAVRQAGYKDFAQEVIVEPAGTTTVFVRMEMDPNASYPSVTGEVKLEVTPDRAGVFVDDKFAGYVHEFGGVKRKMLIAPGKHHIKIELPGYRSFDTDIAVEANQKVTVKTVLAKASITAEGPDLKKDKPQSQP
jgi:hypothetical protein